VPTPVLAAPRRRPRAAALFAVVRLTVAAALAACGADSPSAPAEPRPATVGATDGGTAAACAGTPATLASGQALVLAAGTGVCVGGGDAGAEYAIVAFNGAASARTRAQLAVTGSGIQTVTAALAAVVADGAGFGAAAGGISASRAPSRALDTRLRALAARDLSPRVGGARSWYASRTTTGARRSLIPAAARVGDLVTLNVNADDACASPRLRGARVAAVSNKAVVVADTLNPAGGFTDAEYLALATTFDTLIAPVEDAAFGAPTDVDGNGRVVLFVTSTVNELTPANAGWYVGGFFWARDLFPATGAEACAGSNAGELFYLLAADPRGTINDNAWSKDEVTDVVTAIVAHEYQHLINASRRLYVTGAADFEELWLDEGLSHVAEELVFYRAAGLAPRQNLGATAIRRSAAAVNAFNAFAIENFGRVDEFLRAPSSNSPYAADDSLATRGATWSFLRWAADHQGAADGAVWSRLVNASTAGMANLRGVFGSDLTPVVRDWATALLLDDVAGADARHQDLSWGYRSLFGALSSSYPLAASSLADGVAQAVSVVGGGAAYLRFGVAAGRTGGVSWAALPADVQLTLVRTR
jgi:hypothetical protein